MWRLKQIDWWLPVMMVGLICPRILVWAALIIYYIVLIPIIALLIIAGIIKLLISRGRRKHG